jgi:hypothetical protein
LCKRLVQVWCHHLSWSRERLRGPWAHDAGCRFNTRWTAKAQDKFTRHQNVERYRRLLKTATDEKRRDYLGRLIAEEQQRQKDAGDSAYPY